MSEENPTEQEFSPEDEKKFQKNGLRQYGIYSAIVFQMLATMGLGFWGGKKINDYFEFESNLLIVGICLMIGFNLRKKIASDSYFKFIKAFLFFMAIALILQT